MAEARKPVSEAQILIAGTIRNGRRFAVRELDQIRRTFRGARQVRALVVESDSTDGTATALAQHFVADPWGEVRSLGHLAPAFPLRTARLAHCRNEYLTAFLNEAAYRGFDYLVVADLDGVNRHLTRSAVESCWSVAEPWDAVTGNQLGAYYDLWSLRVADWCPDDCRALYNRLRLFADEKSALRLAIKARRLTVREDAPPMGTESSFGCFAIYRREILRDARYDGVDRLGGEVCEHVALNSGIRAAGGRIVLNPKLITRIRIRSVATLMRAVRARRLA